MVKIKTGLFLLLFLTSILAAAQSKIIYLNKQGKGDLNPVLKINRVSGRISEIEVTIPAIRVSEYRHQDKTYNDLSIKGFSTISKEGKPALPVWNKFILLADDRLPDIQIKDIQYQELTGFTLAPVQPLPGETPADQKQLWVKDEQVFSQDAFFPEKNYSTGAVQTVRGRKIALLSLYPVQYNPQQNKLRILVSFTVVIRTGGLSAQKVNRRLSSAAFSGLLNRLVLNPVTSAASLSKEGTNVLDDDGLSGCDYLIITHPDFMEAADSLTAWRRLCGLRTKISDVDETGSTAEDIRAYLQWAYDSWDIVPQYVLFLGDAEFVPTNYVTQHPSEGQGKIGTDLYYVTTDGSDLLADMAYGRVPVNTALEGLSYVLKVIKYEKNPPQEPAFYNQAEMLAYFQDEDDPDTEPNERDGYSDRRFVLTSEEMRDYLLAANYSVERIYYAKTEVTPTHYSTSYANGEPLPDELLRDNGFLWDGNASQISAAINNGTFFVSHRDHGSRSGWGEPAYKSGSVAALTNGDKLPLVFSVNCQTGWFDNETDAEECSTAFDNECFVEYWLQNFLGGAIGVFGSTRISYSGYNDALVKGFFDAFWPAFLDEGNIQPLPQMGLALNYGKMYMAGQYAEGSKLGVELEEFHYFGDPATSFRNRLPQEFFVQTPENPRLNQTDMVVQTGVPAARVSLVQNGRLIATAESDQNGQALLDFQPLHSQNKVQICVTKTNYRPWLTELPVLSPQGSSLTCLSATIADQNGDDAVNMGEQISWNILVYNNGTETLAPVTLSLKSDNEHITLLDSISRIEQIESGARITNSDLRFKVSERCSDGTFISMLLTISAEPDVNVQIPLDFSVQQGRPEMEISSSLVGAYADSVGETLQESLSISNHGFGVLHVQVKDKAKEFISPCDTLNPVWDNVANGIGNIYEISDPVNLLRFSTYMSFTAATQVYFFVYEGNDFKGLYHKIAQSEVDVHEAQQGYLWSAALNAPLQENHFYYIGVSWEGSAAVSRMNASAPLVLNIGTLKTGCVNLGGVPPQDEVNQVVNLFTPYLQQLETGQGDWLDGLPFQAKLYPGEESHLVLDLSATKPDTLFRTSLCFLSNDLARDSVIVPLYLNVADSGLGLAAQAGRLFGEDGSEVLSPGKTTDIPVELKNIGTQTLYGLSARFDCSDSTLEVQNRLVTYPHLTPGELVSEQAFSVRVKSETPPGKKLDYRVLLRSENGFSDTLTYHTTIHSGTAEIELENDSIRVSCDVLQDTVQAEFSVRNSGFGTLQLQLQNPLRRQVNSGTPAENSWWPDGSGFGNILYQISSQNLLAVRYYLKTDAPTTFYFFVYEGDALKGDYTLICSTEKQMGAFAAQWIESPKLDCMLDSEHYYYIGVSWQGSASVGRAAETVPYQTEKGVVYSSAYKLGGAPPQMEINQPYKVSYPVAQQLICGQGLWLDWDEDSFSLVPGEQKNIALRFIATQPETTLTATVNIVSNDPQNETVKLPLQFDITAKSTSIADGGNRLPASPRLFQNYPNPFNNATRISYAISRPGPVEIQIYNVLGQRVKTLLHRNQQPGQYRLVWNGLNQNGKALSSGLYFLVLKTQGKQLRRKLILLK